MIKSEDAARFLLIIAIILFLFFPALDAIRPFHVGIFPFLGAIVFSKIKPSNVVLTLLVVFVGFLSVLLTVELLSNLSINFIWAGLPLIFFLWSYWLSKNMLFSLKEIQNVILILLSFSTFFIVIQLLFPLSPIMSPYLALTHHSDTLSRYLMVIAPLGNPNITGMMFALVIILSQFFKQFISNNKISLYINLLSFILLIGIVFCFARTILGALIIFFIVIWGKNSIKNIRNFFYFIIGIMVLVSLVVYFYDDFSRYTKYFSTIFTFYEDNSFISRFENWFITFDLIQKYPLSLLVGISQYEPLMYEIKGASVIDSNFLYLFLNHGLIICFALIVAGGFLAFKNIFFLSIMIFLLIASVTIPYMSDYRVGVFIGFIIGLFESMLNRKNKDMNCFILELNRVGKSIV